MQLSEIYQGLGEQSFGELLKSVSMGKLKTFQLYDRMKVRLHLPKLNSDTLRRSAPKLWERVQTEEEFASDLAQSVLVSHLDMIRAVLDFLQVPHEDGFFAKDTDVTSYLKDDWAQRSYDQFKDVHPKAALVFYLNHLGWELIKDFQLFNPAK